MNECCPLCGKLAARLFTVDRCLAGSSFLSLPAAVVELRWLNGSSYTAVYRKAHAA